MPKKKRPEPEFDSPEALALWRALAAVLKRTRGLVTNEKAYHGTFFQEYTNALLQPCMEHTAAGLVTAPELACVFLGGAMALLGAKPDTKALIEYQEWAEIQGHLQVLTKEEVLKND